MRGWIGLATVFLAAACGGGGGAPPPPGELPRWDCADGWVALAEGGCGPPAACGAGECPGVVATPLPGGWPIADAPPTGGLYVDEGGPTPAVPPRDYVPAFVAEARPGYRQCPDGFSLATDGACETVVRDDCPDGAGPLPGGECTPTGEADCPEGDFPAAPADPGGATVVHVLAGADPGLADGSPEAPYPDLETALTAAGPDAWLLVGAGDYPDTDVRVGGGETVRIEGLCAARVSLSNNGVLLLVGGGELDVSGVTLGGEAEAIWSNEGSAVARRVVIDGAGGSAVWADDSASLTLEDSLVARTHFRTTGGGPDDAWGLHALRGGRITARRVALEGHPTAAVRAAGTDAEVVLSDVTIRDTVGNRLGEEGWGIDADSRGVVRGTRVVVDGSRGAGVRAIGAGAAVSLDHAVVRGIAPLEQLGGQAHAVLADAGAEVVVRDARLSGGRGATLRVDRGARAVVERARVGGAAPPEGGLAGAGVTVTDGTVELSSVELFDSDNGGLVAAGAAVVLRDVAFRVLDGPIRARGLQLTGGSLDAERLTFHAVRERAIRMVGGATATIDGLFVDGVPAGCVGMTWGWGIQLDEESTLTLRDAALERVRGVGVGVEGGSTATLDGVVVRDAETCDDGALGLGLYVGNEAIVDGRHLRVSGVHDLGVYVWGGSATVSDALVEGHRPAGEGVTAAAAVLVSPGTLSARRLVVRDVREVGVGGLFGADLELTDSVVWGVTGSERGFGLGVGVSVGATARLERVAVLRTSGSALAAMSGDNLGFGAAGNAAITGQDVLVSRVTSEQVRFAPGTGSGPEGRAVAYGLHVGSRCSASLTRATLRGGGHGFYAGAAARSVTLEGALIQQQLEAAGATAGEAEGVVTLSEVGMVGNGVDEVIVDPTLPEATAIAPPAAVCAGGGC